MLTEAARCWRSEHKDAISAINRRSYLKHAEKRRADRRAYVQANKEVVAARKKAYYEQNKDQISEQRQQYYLQNRDEILVKHREYYRQVREAVSAKNKARGPEWRKRKQATNRRHYDKHPEARKNTFLKVRYGMTLDEFNVILERQGGVCAVCGKSEWNSKGPVVDHDHDTGAVRGVLCAKCNTGAGMLKDDPEIVQRLLDYLRRHKETP